MAFWPTLNIIEKMQRDSNHQTSVFKSHDDNTCCMQGVNEAGYRTHLSRKH